MLAAINICRNKHEFVAANTCLSREKCVRRDKFLSRQAYHDKICILLGQTRVCRDKKIILMAALANDI